jgi:hypothetical protein
MPSNARDILGMNLLQLLETLDDPRQHSLLRIYQDHGDLFHHGAGGNNHPNWPGGYADHVAEIIRINRILYPAMNVVRPLPFTMGQADVVLFFHDIEKPFKYGPPSDPRVMRFADGVGARLASLREQHLAQNAVVTSHDEAMWAEEAWEGAKGQILQDMTSAYGFEFSPEEVNGMRYIHGEGKHHRKDRRVAGPLAAHVHHCDNASARIWYDEGKGLG